MKLTDKDLTITMDSGFTFTVEAKFGNQKWTFNQHPNNESIVQCHFNESENKQAVWLKGKLSGVEKEYETPVLNASDFIIDHLINFPEQYTEASFRGLALRTLIDKLKQPNESIQKPLSTTFLYQLCIDETKP